jgi:hypothetical protein
VRLFERTCRNSSWHVHKLFSAYFHKLSSSGGTRTKNTDGSLKITTICKLNTKETEWVRAFPGGSHFRERKCMCAWPSLKLTGLREYVGWRSLQRRRVESIAGRFIFKEVSWENKRDKGKKRGKRLVSRQDILIIC